MFGIVHVDDATKLQCMLPLAGACGGRVCSRRGFSSDVAKRANCLLHLLDQVLMCYLSTSHRLDTRHAVDCSVEQGESSGFIPLM